MPSCTGIVTSMQGTSDWACISASIPTCSGTNEVLHWSGSSWSCYTISSGEESCNWVTWNPPCRCLGAEGVACTYNIYPVLIHQRYCSGGIVTLERDAYCCPTDINGMCVIT